MINDRDRKKQNLPFQAFNDAWKPGGKFKQKG